MSRTAVVAGFLAAGCAAALCGCAAAGAPTNARSPLGSPAASAAPSRTGPVSLTITPSSTAQAPSYEASPLSSAQVAALHYPPQCAQGGNVSASTQLALRNLEPLATSIEVRVGQIIAVSIPDPHNSQAQKKFPPSVLPDGLVCAVGEPENDRPGTHTILLRALKPGRATVRWYNANGGGLSLDYAGCLGIAEVCGTAG